jgi:hypothetical protein
VTTDVRNRIGLTRLIGLDKTGSDELRQEGTNTGTPVVRPGIIDGMPGSQYRSQSRKDRSQDERWLRTDVDQYGCLRREVG